MNKNTQYKQCILQRNTSMQFTWIPEKYAVLDKWLALENNGEWEEGWKVTYVSCMSQEHDETMSHSQDYKKTRESSDV